MTSINRRSTGHLVISRPCPGPEAKEGLEILDEALTAIDRYYEG